MPAVINSNLFIRGSFGVRGGIGHALNDLFTPILLSIILRIRFLYTGIETVPIAKHDSALKGISEHERIHSWSEALGFDGAFSSLRTANGLYDEVVKLQGHGRWSVFSYADVQEIQKLVQDCQDARRHVLFEISNNERVEYAQVVSWEKHGLVEPGTTRLFRDAIRVPFRNNLAVMYPHHLAGRRPKISVHIRNSGVWPDTAEYCMRQRFEAAKISRWLNAPIDVYSEGQEIDLDRIRRDYDGLPVNFHFNEDTIESFLAMATSDVSLGGKSGFFLLSGLFTPGLKVTLHNIASAEMVTPEQDCFSLDEEWLTVEGILDHDLFMQHFEERKSS